MKLSRHGRVLFATIVWVAVGVFLIWRGWPFFEAIPSTGGKILTVVLALVVGIGKGLFVIAKSAARTAAFIARRPAKDWFWMSFHPVLYAVIPVMILMGWGLREWLGQSQPAVVAGVYFGIAAALLAGAKGFSKMA